MRRNPDFFRPSVLHNVFQLSEGIKNIFFYNFDDVTYKFAHHAENKKSCKVMWTCTYLTLQKIFVQHSRFLKSLLTCRFPSHARLFS